MGPQHRTFRILFWPVFTACTVSGLLFVYEREDSLPDIPDRPRSASTRPAPRPWTLSDQEESFGKPRVAWMGPSLQIEQFRRDELTYPFPPMYEIGDRTKKTNQNEFAESTPKHNDLRAPSPQTLAFNQGPIDPLGLPMGPSVIVQENSPAAKLHTPRVSEQENDSEMEVSEPPAPVNPFDKLHLSSNRTGITTEAPTKQFDEPLTLPEVESPLRKSTRTGPTSQWPQTPKLLELMRESNKVNPRTTQWTREVEQQLQMLQRIATLGDPSAEAVLSQLDELAQMGYGLVEPDDALVTQRAVLSATYALERRVQLWTAVWRNLTSEDWSYQSVAMKTGDISALVGAIRQEILPTGDVEGWESFLLLDHIQTAASGRYDDEQRRLIAQRYLSRVEFTEMSDVQREWFNQSSCLRLASLIQPWAHGPVDYVQLLEQVEQQEAESISRSGSKIAWTMQTLRFTKRQESFRIAETINRHYRNANVRLSLSEEMLRRILPDVPDQQSPIRDKVLGAKVRGTSYAKANLDVTLVPDPNAWSLRVGGNGTIKNETWSTQGPAKLNHIGNAQFQAETAIRIDRTGVEITKPQVDVESQNRLRRMRTKYDGFPVVGPMVREYVHSRNQESRPAARQHSESRMRQQIKTQFTESVETQMEQAQSEFSARVIGPLAQLQLTPAVVDLHTTEDRLTVRYRVSGDWQLAAYTPRPRAPTQCLMSLQIHQSALNNALEQLVPKSRQVSIEELAKKNLNVFGLDGSTLTEELPQDMFVQFTSSRPITIEVRDENVELTLRVVRLNKTDGVSFRNFIVRATYVPQIDRLRPMLVRDGHLNISGPRMTIGDRLAIRTIFNRVLSPNRPLDLTTRQLREHKALEGLAITQFELREGWIGFAVGPKDNYMAQRELYSAPLWR